jgi:hypothetical protein
MISSMIIILGFSLAIAGTTVDFKFQSNPTDEQIFTATVRLLKHYKFNVWDEDARALSIRATRKITKETDYYLLYFIEIKEKQISVLANVIGYNSKDTRFSFKWRLKKESHDAQWLIGKVIRTIGTRLDASDFKWQMRK